MEESIKTDIQNSIETKQKMLNQTSIIADVANKIITALKNKNWIYTCGNGGSTCDAMHFAEELVARYEHNRVALPAKALTDSSTVTCTANDFGYTDIFSRQVEAYGRQGDILVAISTSGNSDNILKAVEAAKKLGMITIGMAGKDGGKLKDACDRCIIVPSEETARIQEGHITIFHAICKLIDREFE